MVQSATYFRGKAEQCRRLARSVATRTDPAVTVLETMAAEFDASAARSDEKADRTDRPLGSSGARA